MGATVLKLAALDRGFIVTHVIEAKGHPDAGTKLDVGGPVPLILEDDLSSVIDDADVVIDFTEAASSFRFLKLAAAKEKAIVIGSTGISPEMLRQMKDSPGAKAVISPNMSIGVNLLFNLVETAARVLGTDYDTEIVEMHHKWKKDAPSGTAIRIRDIIMEREPNRNWTPVTGREGMVGERQPDEIGVLSVRGGDIVGEHTVLFSGMGERVEIIHRAYSRENFARGALAAAKWIINNPVGVYDMRDVLGLR